MYSNKEIRANLDIYDDLKLKTTVGLHVMYKNNPAL